MITLVSILLVIAALCFLFSALNLTSPINLVSLGLMFLTLYFLFMRAG